MINDEYFEIAQKYINQISKEIDIDLDIVESSTIYEQEFNVYFYQTRDYLRTNNFLKALAGNAPIIINKKTKEIIVTGTAHSVNYYISNYKKYGNPNYEAVVKTKQEIILKCKEDYVVETSVMKVLRKFGDYGLKDAKEIIIKCIAKKEPIIEIKNDNEIISEFIKEMKSVGIDAEIRLTTAST